MGCICGHLQSDHIYEEGACRSGIICPCPKFVLFKSIKTNVNDPANSLKIMIMTKEFNKNVKVMLSSEKMDWQTPKVLFDKLNALYGPFDLDAAANKDNYKVYPFLTEDPEGTIDGLKCSWVGTGCKKVWLNPPYGRSIGKWLKKAAEEAVKGCTVVCLVPSRTGSKWFQEAVKQATEVLFLKGRVVFETAPGQPVLDKKGKPMAAPFDSVVFVFTPKLPTEFVEIGWWDWRAK